MKLNPFNKKSSAYYDKVKAEHDKLDREMAAAREALQKAEADYERKRQPHHQLLRDHIDRNSDVSDHRSRLRKPRQPL